MGNIAIFTDSLSTLQALNSSDPDQMIQGLHSSLAKLTAQSSASLQWVPAHVGLTGNETADLQKSAVRIRRHRTLSLIERPRHFSTLGTMETGRKKTVDTRHTLTQFVDWSGPSRPLSSACTQGTGLSAHLKRTSISDTSLCECGQADQTPDHVLQPNIYRETSANMAAGC